MPDSSTGGTDPATTIIGGRYELVQRAGEGALFTVFKARDRETGQTVAVKTVKAPLSQNAPFVARLLAEAEAARVVGHPNVARVLDSGHDGPAPYVVTEFVTGVSLRHRIRRTAPLPVAVAVDIAVEMAQALAAIHAHGIVHGDLRPHNVLITTSGQVKVTDIGLARALALSPDLPMNSVLRWVQGMSPEVAEGGPPTPASDTYSLGCVLYEMLGAEPVFPGDNAIAVALKHAREQPRPVEDVNSSTPPALAALVARALEKDPAARYPDGASLLGDLTRVQDALRYNKPLDYTPSQVLRAVTHPTPAPTPVIPEVRYEEVEPQVPRALVYIQWFLLTLLGAGVFLVGWFLYGLFQPQKDIPVPEVMGLQQAAAQKILDARGLQWNVRPRESSRPGGEVLNQDPPPNQSVKPGRTVDLFVSKGPKMAAVPDLSEMSLERARQEAAEAGVAIKKASEKYSEDVQKGYVIDQNPPAREQVKPGSTVKVTVSLGPEPKPEPPPPVLPDPATLNTGVPAVPPPPGLGPTTSAQRTGRVRSFRVSFQIPTKGYEEPVEMQVVVLDERGERTVVDEQRRLGEFITKSIDAVGEKVFIRVYLNGQFYSEQVK